MSCRLPRAKYTYTTIFLHTFCVVLVLNIFPAQSNFFEAVGVVVGLALSAADSEKSTEIKGRSFSSCSLRRKASCTLRKAVQKVTLLLICVKRKLPSKETPFNICAALAVNRPNKMLCKISKNILIFPYIF